MNLLPDQADLLLQKGFSRRQLGRIATLLTAGAGLPFYNEYAMAQDAQRRAGRGPGRGMDPDAVRINQNENPMGPCKEGLEAIAKIAPLGWRYSAGNVTSELSRAIAETEDVKEDHIAVFAGSSDPLHRVSCAFTSPTQSWTMGEPGYGGGAPAFIGSKVNRVPLRADYSHDVEAMVKADPNAGVYYICNPNNPTGTLTPRKDIEYLLAHKSKDGVVLVDEAYIHFTEKAQSCADLVAAGKDVIVLRTFSKIYGMAGLRAGFAMGRPDLLGKLRPYGVGFMQTGAVTGVACAAASLRVKGLVAERRALNRGIREDTFGFLEKNRIEFIPSEANMFMMNVKRPGKEFYEEMTKHHVYIGRVWPVWPTWVRVSVGTRDEMAKFREACLQCYNS